MSDRPFQDFVKKIKTIKRKNQLHGLVENRLAQILSHLYPDACPVSEIYGVPGGRNDMILFFFNQRRIAFELFFSPSQVSQDLRLLELSTADKKIAILLDSEINPNLIKVYFRKKPNHFDYLFLSQIIIPENEALCSARLRELIDENSTINRMRRILSTPAGNQLEKHFREQLDNIEAALYDSSSNITKHQDFTGKQIIALQIIAQLKEMGVTIEHLRSLYVWLQDGVDFAFTLVLLGFHAFLVTDLHGRHAICSDEDLADDIIIGAENSSKPNIIICLNKILNDVWRANGLEEQNVRWHFFHSYEEYIRKIVPIWEPKKAQRRNKKICKK